MKAKDKTELSDRELFQEAVSDVRPLKHDRIIAGRPRPRAIPLQTLISEKRVSIDMMSDDFESCDIETGEELHYARDGIQPKIIRKLKRGQYRLEAELDLHGLNVEAARRAVHDFLGLCQQEDRRCVRIIHGKGLSSRHKGPVLKQMVNRWLRQRKEVLAFTSTMPRHGGTGAIYVLLKRSGR